MCENIGNQPGSHSGDCPVFVRPYTTPWVRVPHQALMNIKETLIKARALVQKDWTGIYNFTENGFPRFYVAADKNGKGVIPQDPTAESFSILGALLAVSSGEEYFQAYLKIVKALESKGKSGSFVISDFEMYKNSKTHECTTHAMVIQIFDQAIEMTDD